MRLHGGMSVGLFVGLTTLDVVHRAPRRPGPDEKLTAARQDVAAGGPAANAAVTFAALGGRARLLTALGRGPLAAAARADLEDHGVEVVDVAPPDHPLAVSAVLVEEGTARRSVVSTDAGRPVDPPPALDVGAPDVVLVDAHHPRLAVAVLDGLAAARRPRPPVLLDTGRWKPQLAVLLPRADVAVAPADLVLPRAGADPLTGGPPLAAALLARGPSAVVVTHGADPVEWWDGSGHGTHAVPAVDAVDTLGAGDAFHGAYAAALAAGVTTPEAVALAADVASRRVRRAGPRAWLADLDPWLARR